MVIRTGQSDRAPIRNAPVKTVLVLLVLPPVNLALLAMAGLVLMRYRPRAGWLLTIVSVVGLVLLSMHAVTSPMLRVLERDLPLHPPANAPPAAIVVLSGDSQSGIGLPGGYTVGELTLPRLRVAAHLHRVTGLPILVSGGGVPQRAPPLADLMTHSLRSDFRVNVRWLERRSTDTWENARFTAEILREADISSIYLVTHAWHMRRSLLAFERTGLRVTAAPTPLRPSIDFTISDFIPSIRSWMDAFYAMHEFIGMIWYSWR